MTATGLPFGAGAIVGVLNRHKVEYIGIGAVAALSQGVPLPATSDIDVTPRTTTENLQLSPTLPGTLQQSLDPRPRS